MKNLANHSLPDGVKQPTYDRGALKSRIVHLGFGAFHRAHQALLTDRVLNQKAGTGVIAKLTCSVEKS